MATRERKAHQVRDYRPGPKPRTKESKDVAVDGRTADDAQVRAAGERAVGRWAGLLRRLSE